MTARIAFFGYAEMGVVCLEALLKAGRVIPMVLTHPVSPEPISGHVPASVLETARRHGIPARAIEPRDHEAVEAALREAHPDLLVSVNWRGLFRPAALAIPRQGALNLHGSLLPRYRGNAPVTWAILSGETRTGATVHFIDEGMDTGAIVAQAEVPLSAHDSVQTVLKRLEAMNAELILRAVSSVLDGSAKPRMQDPAQATVGRRRRPEDGQIDWSCSAKEVYDLIRGVTYPLPGAFTFYQGQRFVIWEAAVLDDLSVHDPPGTVMGYLVGMGEGNIAVGVSTGKGILMITKATENEGTRNDVPRMISDGKLRKGECFGER